MNAWHHTLGVTQILCVTQIESVVGAEIRIVGITICDNTGGPSSRLEKANDEFMNASRVVWLGVKLLEEPLKIWTRYKE